MAFDIETYLADRPEKYRDTSRWLYQFIQARAGDNTVRDMGGHGIIGWGDNGDGWFLVGMCCRATGALLYTSAYALDQHNDLLRSRRTGLTCLKLTRPGTVDEAVLDDIVRTGFNPPRSAEQYYGKAGKTDDVDRLENFAEYLKDKPEHRWETGRHVYELIRDITGGERAYRYDDHVLGFGKRADGWYKICIAVRSSGVMLYSTDTILDRYADVIKKSHRTGKGCLKLLKPDSYPEAMLRDILQRSWAQE